MYVLIVIVIFLVIGVFIFNFARRIGEWFANNNAPKLTVKASIIDKRSVTHHHHHSSQVSLQYHTHSYCFAFELSSGECVELCVPESDYSSFTVGDSGLVTFQGSRYFGFERKDEETTDMDEY